MAVTSRPPAGCDNPHSLGAPLSNHSRRHDPKMNNATKPHSDHSNDGVRATRRAVFRGGVTLASLGVLSSWANAHSRRPPRHVDDVAGFLDEWTERAHEITGSEAPNEDACVHELCAGLARLDPDGFPERSRVTFEKDGMRSGPVAGDGTFIVIQFDLEPGAVIRAHNHVGWSFISYGVAGDASVRHFEPVGKGADPKEEIGKDFLVREVSSTVLVPGRTSSLTRTRANVHWFQAGEKGATFLDFGIHFPGPGDGPKAQSSMEFDEEPRDPKLRIFNARWIGNPYAKK